MAKRLLPLPDPRNLVAELVKGLAADGKIEEALGTMATLPGPFPDLTQADVLSAIAQTLPP